MKYKEFILVFLFITLVFIWLLIRGRSEPSDLALESGVRVSWINKGYGADGNHGEYNPAMRLQDLIREFGSPSVLDASSGGVAIWNRSLLESAGKPYDRVEIRDEQIPHGSHSDFLYVTIDYAIPQERVPQVLGLSESIMVDSLKKQVIVRCHSMAAIKVTLALVLRIADSEISLGDIEEQGLFTSMLLSGTPGQSEYDVLQDSRLEAEIAEKVTWFREANQKELSWGLRK